LMRCCVDDGGLWPSGAALQGEASNHLMLRWLKTVVVSDEEKAPGEVSGRGQEDEHRRSVENLQMTSEPGRSNGPGMSLAGAC
jgi:hypothetical protein